MRIVAFSGKIGSGKDYLSEELQRISRFFGFNTQIIAFADYLKITTRVKDKISHERLFYEKDEESRRILQTRGMIERKDNDNIYVDVMECLLKIAEDRNMDFVIISDLRFENEFEFLRNRKQHHPSTLIRIEAPQRTLKKIKDECKGDETKVLNISSHISETSLDKENTFDYYIKNDYRNEQNTNIVLEDIFHQILNKV